MSEADQLLGQSSGSGAPAVRFTNVGDKIIGIITRVGVATTNDLNTGEPVKSVVIDLTDDDGDEHTLWVKRGQMSAAVTAAARTARPGATEGLLREGDRLAVQYQSTEPAKTPGHSPKKIYAAKLVAGATPEPVGRPLDEII